MNEHKETLMAGLDSGVRIVGQNLDQMGLNGAADAVANLQKIMAALEALRSQETK